MKCKSYKTEFRNIQSFRSLFLQENNFQIRYNACHERNWSDSYLLTIDDVEIGYGSVKGKDKLSDRDAVFEFYIIPRFRKAAGIIFRELLKASNTIFIECQSNDFLLSSMLYEFAQNINSEMMLFKDHIETEWKIPDVIFRRRREG